MCKNNLSLRSPLAFPKGTERSEAKQSQQLYFTIATLPERQGRTFRFSNETLRECGSLKQLTLTKSFSLN